MQAVARLTKGGQIWRENDNASAAVAGAAEDVAGRAVAEAGGEQCRRHWWWRVRARGSPDEATTTGGRPIGGRRVRLWGWPPERTPEKVAGGGGQRRTVVGAAGMTTQQWRGPETGRTTQFLVKNFTGGQWALLIARFRVAFFFRL